MSTAACSVRACAGNSAASHPFPRWGALRGAPFFARGMGGSELAESGQPRWRSKLGSTLLKTVGVPAKDDARALLSDGPSSTRICTRACRLTSLDKAIHRSRARALEPSCGTCNSLGHEPGLAVDPIGLAERPIRPNSPPRSVERAQPRAWAWIPRAHKTARRARTGRLSGMPTGFRNCRQPCR